MDMRHRDRESAKRGTKESVRSEEKVGKVRHKRRPRCFVLDV